MAQLAVVTKAPEGFGNLAMPGAPLHIVTAMAGSDNDYQEQTKPLDVIGILSLRQKVFEVGEILILDDSGREIGFPGRKPSKWDIEIQHVNSFEEAAYVASEAMSNWREEDGS